MAQKLPKKDVAIIGLGWTGSILAQELTDEGLDVIAIERGPWRDAPTDFPTTYVQDELRYRIRHELFLRPEQMTFTFRNKMDQQALPIRTWGAFMPMTGVGGGGVHWNAETFRFLPSDFVLKTHLTQRYGAKFLPEDMTIQDYGVTYDDLEPHYDRFEYLCGTSGAAGNLKGQILEGGNPFEGPRSRPYPTPAQEQPFSYTLFAKAARELGYKPFPQPSGNLSQAYENPLGVRFVDTSGEEWEQPADLVILAAFSVFNIQLLLLSGVGKPYDPAANQGVIGRNFTHQPISQAIGFFDKDKFNFNPFIASGSIGMCIDEFNGDNFDHGPLGFVGGGYLGQVQTNGRPIQTTPVPPGTPRWGAKWKNGVRDNYLSAVTPGAGVHGSFYAYRDVYLDLDPLYRDHLGQPLVRITIDFHENEIKQNAYLTDKFSEIIKAMGATSLAKTYRTAPYDATTYQTTHLNGGVIMGADTKTSAVNRYLQSWDVSNLFVLGASAFPQNAGYNPTLTVGALAYWAADAIRNQYLKNPGRLVDA